MIYILETDIILYINYTSIRKKGEKKKQMLISLFPPRVKNSKKQLRLT